MNILVGKKVIAVHLATDQKAIKFDIENGESVIAKTDGDCCSSSWIEALDAPEALIGTVSAVEDMRMPQSVDDDNEDSVIAFYGCKITTEKGSCVIDYRNESNGYYGGNLYWPKENKRDYDYFYGGVYGQNISTEEWRRIA